MGELCSIFGIMERDESLRVLHIASWYPSRVHDSLGNFIQRHVAAVATKHKCELWYASPVGGESPLLGTVEVIDGDGFVERITYPRVTKPGVRAVTRALLKLVPGEDLAMPDLVHLHVAFPAGRAARILAERWDVPLIITEHWTAYHDSQHIPLWRRISMRRTAASTNTFCPVTYQLGEKMREFKMVNSQGNEEYTTVPNVVDTDKFTLSKKSREKGEAVKLLHVSSLEDTQKNITGILHTIAHLRATRPDFKFNATFVGGSDPERLTKVRRYAASLNLTAPTVLFTGPKNSDEVADLMRESDAVILFSRKENFPCVIAEAWASGKSVITTDVGGISEHMADERGMLIPSGDERALAASILKLDNDWDAKSIRKYAVDRFSVNSIAEQFDKVYRTALGGKDDAE